MFNHKEWFERRTFRVIRIGWPLQCYEAMRVHGKSELRKAQ